MLPLNKPFVKSYVIILYVYPIQLLYFSDIDLKQFPPLIETPCKAGGPDFVTFCRITLKGLGNFQKRGST